MNKKIANFFYKMLIAYFISQLTLGCVSLTDTDLTLEKSEPETPEWVTLNSKKNTQDNVYFVFKKDNIFNLNLGLKQAQSAARMKAAFLVMSQVKSSIQKHLKDSPLLSDDQRDSLFLELDEYINITKPTFKTSEALPKAVYWEYRQKDTENGTLKYYTVWVLLSVASSDYKAALTATVHNLEKTNSAGFKELGQSLLQNMPPE